MLDMIRPATKNQITLQDLKRCKMTPVFFDTFFNLEKYLDHEQRDPFATQREVDEEGNEVLIDSWTQELTAKLIGIFFSSLTGTGLLRTSTNSWWLRRGTLS